MSPCLGQDVAKNKGDAALLMDNGKFKNKGFAKTAKGFAELLTWLARHGAAQAPVCMEAAGIFHEAVAACLYDNGRTVSVVNPQRIKSSGASEGIRAKTDQVDARLIARFGKLMQPQPRQPVPLEIRTLRAPGRRRDELIVMRTQESNRAGGNEELIEESIESLSAALEHELAEIERKITELVAGRETLQKRIELLQSIPGIGPVCAFCAEKKEKQANQAGARHPHHSAKQGSRVNRLSASMPQN